MAVGWLVIVIVGKDAYVLDRLIERFYELCRAQKRQGEESNESHVVFSQKWDGIHVSHDLCTNQFNCYEVLMSSASKMNRN